MMSNRLGLYIGIALGTALVSLPLDRAMAREKPTQGSRGVRGGPKGEDAALAYMSLTYAAGHGDADVVRAWLARGVDVNGRGFESNAGDLGEKATMMDAPIVLAAEGGHLEVVKVLLEAGAKPDKCCCSCVTALHQAIRNKHSEIVKVLLDSGASPARLFDGKTTPLELAIKSGDTRSRQYVEERLKKSGTSGPNQDARP